MKNNCVPGSVVRGTFTAAVFAASFLMAVQPVLAQSNRYKAPAGKLPAIRHVQIGSYDAAVLPNGKLVTPVGVETVVGAPKPFGLALSPDGNTLATVNSGIRPFSVSLITGLNGSRPSATVIPLNASFLGITFSADSTRFYASGGEKGNIWVGDTASAEIIGSVNLNGSSHPYGTLSVTAGPANYFKGTYPGRMALSSDGKYLYITDQGAFQVLVVDTTKIATGLDSSGNIAQPDNFAAVVGAVKVGRYPFGIALSSDNHRLYVTNVGIFQYSHLDPVNPTGDSNVDYPLCYPGAGYPTETENDRTIQIHKVDPRNLPTTLSVPDGIQCGYIPKDQSFTVPGLGPINAPESSSVYVFDTSNPTQPSLLKIARTGLQIGDSEDSLPVYAGSHPNAVAIGSRRVYVSNGNNDTVSVLSRKSNRELGRIDLSFFNGADHHIKGAQPVAVTLSPDETYLYVAEAGINAVAVVRLGEEGSGSVQGLIPTGWWPSAVQVSASGKTLYIASANGRGAGPDNNFPPDNLGSPRSSTIGTVNILPVPSADLLARYTRRVLSNNRAVGEDESEGGPIPTRPGVASSQIHHIVFINKENATHDLVLGDITQTRKGVPVAGEPAYSLGYAATPNHHELALQFAFGDNFFLEPSVSSDGHRWLTDTFTTEFEQTHWPASYGGERNDAGDDPNVYGPFPGRLGFTDANSSPTPEDYNQHGGTAMHVVYNGKTFVNFGNGYEFAEVDESGGTDTTGIRNHVNVPMEAVIRDNSDHLYPEFNTAIPDGPLPEDPMRFSRFGRFQQVFEANYVDASGACKLPNFVDLYYPNDHTGGAFDINPNGPAWSPIRFFQDNDEALGMTVDLISHSPCWKDTVIFVVEDDTQNGFDHVDGSRSLFLASSPWVKRNYVSKTHLSLSSIFKTVNEILGIPALNQYDASATDLRDLFTSTPNFAPYNYTPIAFDGTASAAWKQMTAGLDFSRPDGNELQLRQAIAIAAGIPQRKPGKEHKK
jgi:DNA-binding beta-propeller fold protein YncE